VVDGPVVLDLPGSSWCGGPKSSRPRHPGTRR